MEWIPITHRPLTDEEKSEFSEEVDCIFDCPLPEDGQEVLITTRYGNVTIDTFRKDDGCYFEQYCDDDDVLAWMTLPDKYVPDKEQ